MTRIGFTGAGVYCADHLRLDQDRLIALAGHEHALAMCLDGLDPILGADGRLLWEAIEGEAERIFLGLRDDRPLFAPVPMGVPAKPRWTVFDLISRLTADEAALWGGARSLIEWHNRHLFCAMCGGATALFRGGWGRRCGQGHDHFPRVDPVVIMLAEHDGRILLGRQPQYPPGRYSALAGFVEPGELIEEAVAREIGEEAGLAVGAVRYVASQPWPFPGQLMIACVAEALDDVLTLDLTELEHAFWATRAEVEQALAGAPDARFLAPPPFAIAHSLLRWWIAQA